MPTSHTTLHSDDDDDLKFDMYFKLSLSYTWCEGSEASEHEPKSYSHVEDIRVVDAILMSSRGRFVSYDDHDKARLVEHFNMKLEHDLAFMERALKACFEKEEADHQTALAERDEAKSRKWDE